MLSPTLAGLGTYTLLMALARPAGPASQYDPRLGAMTPLLERSETADAIWMERRDVITPDQIVDFTIRLHAKHQAQVEKVMAQLSTPGTASYGQWLSADEAHHVTRSVDLTRQTRAHHEKGARGCSCRPSRVSDTSRGAGAYRSPWQPNHLFSSPHTSRQ